MLTNSAGARTLYLGAGRPKRVTCTEEALVVNNDRAQTQRFPVKRIARVVTASVVDWSGPALAMCLRHGIPISWMDARGQPLGACYPARTQACPIAAALEVLLEIPDGRERYQLWLRTRRMEVLMRWARQQGAAISPRQWEATKRDWVYAGVVNVHLPMALRAHCLAFVDAQLARQGLAPVYWDASTQTIHLDDDLCELLWAEMNLQGGNLANGTDHEASATALFEQWIARHADGLVTHLSSLHRFAMRETYP